jgi:hypothetical protein
MPVNLSSFFLSHPWGAVQHFPLFSLFGGEITAIDPSCLAEILDCRWFGER